MTEQPKVQIVNLSRELATMLVDKAAEHQRTIRPGHVEALKLAMLNDEWRLSDSAIIIVRDPITGVIESAENGQHRAHARLALPIDHVGEFPVLLLEKPEASIDDYLVYDTGVKRSFGDWLKAQGTTDVFQRASIVNACWAIEHDPNGSYPPAQQGEIPMTGLAKWWEACDHDLLDRSISEAVRVRSKAGGTVKILGSVFYLGSRDWDADGMIEFYDAVRLGQDPHPDARGVDPAVLLHRRLLDWRLANVGRVIQPRVQWMHVVRALHGWQAGERPKRLVWRPNRDVPLPLISAGMRREIAERDADADADAAEAFDQLVEADQRVVAAEEVSA